jgi:hypothetical protein
MQKESWNIHGTKILIWSITLNGRISHNVQKQCILGVIFAISGNFTNAKTDLYKKELKAYFKYVNVLMYIVFMSWNCVQVL